MSEPRKNHVSIDGGQVKEDDNVASYKPIPDSDTDFRSSKSNISKSKEKVSPDGAEEKLLQKEDESKVVRVDMADAKYVVGDHRNGDAKIELDANKRQFSGLTKEELLKYADDPFWVNLRWCMFVLFWTLWLAMLAGAITIIVRAPSCPAPTHKQWYEKWLLVESSDAGYDELSSNLDALQSSKVEGIFMTVPTYDVLDDAALTDTFADFVKQAKEKSIKVIVDLIPNYVSINHTWFQQSQNRSSPFSDYFIWAPSNNFEEGQKQPPNNWRSKTHESAWSLSEARDEFYLHQYGEHTADLNFRNPTVVDQFKKVMRHWMDAGAAGVRLNKARELLVIVDPSSSREVPASGRGAAPVSHASHDFARHRDNTDLPDLDRLLLELAHAVDGGGDAPGKRETVFTLKEAGDRAELYLLAHNVSCLRPPSAAPLPLTEDVDAAAKRINQRLNGTWPAIQLVSDSEGDAELAVFSLLLPAAPVLALAQLGGAGAGAGGALAHVAALRADASLEHGHYAVQAAPAHNDTHNQLIVCARWKASHTGYVSVYNPTDVPVRGDVSRVPSLPPQLTVYHVSAAAALATNYTAGQSVSAAGVWVAARSTVVLSYVPDTAAQQ